jgi:OOP family OmpA-OmpF porin
MKIPNSFTKLMVATATIGSVFFSTSSFADEQTGFYLKAGANHFIFDSDRLIKDEFDYYLGAGYQFSEHWGVDYEYTDVITQSNLGSKYYFDVGTINAIYRHQARGNNSLFWKVGVGKTTGTTWTPDTSAARLGVGYDFTINQRFSLQVGADALFAKKENFNDSVAYVGLSYFFGKDSTEKTPIVFDSDKDGVVDARDQCPNTPANTKVDTVGCEFDSDKDGMVNSIDQCPDTPLGAKVDDRGCRLQLSQSASIILTVEFALESSIIAAKYNDDIKRIADFMVEYPDSKVVIEGNTDSSGTVSYNQKLSRERAKAVMAYLVTKLSVDPARVSAVGFGEGSPIASNATSQGRKTNRRAHADITAKFYEAEK